MNNNIIWFNNINNLFNKDTFLEIIPTSNMNNSEKINAITRFTLYLSILLYLSSGNYLYFYIVLITILITYLVYVFNNKENFDKISENSENSISNENSENSISNEENCKKPTEDNPLMNPLIGESTYEKKACDIKDNKILESVDKKFCNKLFQNTSNIFSNRFEQRAFYTNPNTRVPNDQSKFANWLYKTPISCAIGDTGKLKQYKSCAYDSKMLSEIKKEL